MNPRILCFLCVGGLAMPGLCAEPTQAGAPTVTSGGAGLLNDWLRDQYPTFERWDIGGQFRLRGEHRENFAVPGLRPEAVDFRKDGGAGNTFLLLREKLHLGYRPTDWVGAYAEARDSSAHWDRRDPSPEADCFDLHQAYVMFGDLSEFPLVAKIGRQELAYGDERLVGALDWSNVGRVFDAAKLRFQQPSVTVDAFTGRVIIPDDGNFNVSNDYEWFSGVYASSRQLLPKHETQVYFLARNTGVDSPNAIGQDLPPSMRGASARDIYTVGTRLKSSPGQFAGWDYQAEAAGQFGNFKSTSTGDRLDHRAFAATVAGGHTWVQAWGSPRLGLEYNFATGDSDPNDDEHETFDNLFPTNHRFYGFMDFASWQNMHNLRLAGSLKPHKKLSLTLDYHAFWLANTEDYFYQANGAPRSTGGYGLNPDGGRFIGTELDLIVTWNVTRFASIQGGYGHFFAADYLDDSLAQVGGATDADWIYLQAVVNF